MSTILIILYIMYKIEIMICIYTHMIYNYYLPLFFSHDRCLWWISSRRNYKFKSILHRFLACGPPPCVVSNVSYACGIFGMLVYAKRRFEFINLQYKHYKYRVIRDAVRVCLILWCVTINKTRRRDGNRSGTLIDYV